MPTDLVVAILGLATAVIGLIAAVVGRKKENIHRTEVIHRNDFGKPSLSQPPGFFSGQARGSRVLLGVLMVPLLLFATWLVVRLIAWMQFGQ
jgi:hypothetical protein